MDEDIHILSVDDNEDNLWFIKYGVVRKLKYKNFGEAHDGVEALEYLNENPDVDLILLDRMMPRKSGIELFDEIKNDPKFIDIEVLFQSGRSLENELQEFLDHGANIVMCKPFPPENLIAFVEHAVEKIRRKKLFKNNINKEELKEEYIVNNFEEAKEVAIIIANNSDKENKYIIAEAIYGLIENAIEHGNLSLNNEKFELYKNRNYHQTISEKLTSDKIVKIKCKKNNSQILVKMEDQGEGFNLENYNKINIKNLTDFQGRGIIFARKYLENLKNNTNIVEFTV